MCEWISVEDRLPESGKEIFIAVNGITVEGYKYYTDAGCFMSVDGDKFYPFEISHWMPLPEPPE